MTIAWRGSCAWLLPLALCLLPLAAAEAQQDGGLAGTVRDSASGQPLSSVLVQILGAGGTPVAAGTTGPEGAFRIEGIEPGTYAVRFVLPGWETRTVEGQEVPAGQLASLPVVLVERSYNLNPITVTASRTEEKVLDAPAAVQVRSTRDLEEEPALTVADHVRGMPGVDIITTGLQGSYIVARGFNNIFSGAMLTLTDNRIARVPSLRANISHLNPVTNLDLERVEVVLGPGSALYGPNAASGVLHSITKSPIDYPGANFSVAGGLRQQSAGTGFEANDEDLFQAEGRMAWASQNEDVGVKVSGAYFTGVEWRFTDPVEAEEQEIASGCIATGFDLGTDACLNFAQGLDLQDPEDQALLIESVENVAAGRDNDLERWSFDVRADWRPDESTALILSGGRTQAVSSIDLTGLGAAQVNDWGYNYLQGRFLRGNFFSQVFFNKSDNEDSYLLRSGRPLVDRSSLLVAQAQHSTRTGERQNFIYGVDLLRTVPQTQGTINGQNEDDDEITEFGGYLQSETALTDRLDLVLAARLDHHSILDEVVFSPRAAAVFQPNQENSFRATYNRAFSTPTTLNLFLDISGGTVPLFGPFAYDLRAQGVTANGLNFRFQDGVPMHMSPFAGTPREFFPTTTPQLWQEMVAAAGALAAGGAIPADLAQLLAGLPAPSGEQVGILPMTLSPDSVAAGAANPFVPTPGGLAGVEDIPILEPTITNTLELGYRGLLGESVSLAANFWYSHVNDFVSALRVSSPNVFLNPAELTAYLEANFVALVGTAFPDEETARATAQQVGPQLGSIPLGVVTAQDVGGSSPTLFLTYRNLGDVDLLGTDLSISYLFGEGWNLSGNLSLVNKDEFEAGEGAEAEVVPLNAPKVKGGVSLGYRAGENGFNGSFAFRHQGGFSANSGVYIGEVDDHQVFDLNVGYRFARFRSLQVQLDVQNVFDAEYRTFVGTPQLGRFALLRVRYDFDPF